MGRFNRLSLSKGEGRVRVCSFSSRAVLEPLTSILSPCSKGRGGEKRMDVIGAFIREPICVALPKFLARLLGIAPEFSCHRGLEPIRDEIALHALGIRDGAAP